MSSVIFDFDGTLADSFQVFIDIAYEISGRIEPLPEPEIDRLRGMRPAEVMKELNIRAWKVPLLVYRGRRQMRARMSRVKVFKDMPAVIKELVAEGHQLYIMSSNSVQNIQPFLKQHNMNTEFIKIYGNVGVFAKARVLRRVIRQNKLARETSYYVGDEVRDVVAAQNAGVHMIAVAWGYNNAAILQAHQPEFLAQIPTDILASVQ